MATLPEGVNTFSEIEYVDRPTNTFIIDREGMQVAGTDDGLDAMRQAVDIILNTERFRWQIYGSNFGIELEDLIGDEYDYIVAELPERIRDAFSVDSRILSVDDFEFKDTGSGSMTASFTVSTVFGIFDEEVTI